MKSPLLISTGFHFLLVLLSLGVFSTWNKNNSSSTVSSPLEVTFQTPQPASQPLRKAVIDASAHSGKIIAVSDSEESTNIPAATKLEIPTTQDHNNPIERPNHFWSTPLPPYPEQARRNRLEGTAWIQLTSDEQGAIQDAKLFRTSGSSLLDESALQATKHWRITPRISVVQPVVFRLSK